MGGLRFVLAALVMMSHLSIGFHNYNIGVMAVIVFYLLAGQVVVRLWARMRNRPNAVSSFARDRLLRIMPQYLAGIILSSLVWWLAGPDSGFLKPDPTLLEWLGNLLVIPLNFYMYGSLEKFTLIPPAWSLGAELQFYLLTPLIFSQKSTRLLLLFLLSFAVFVIAQLGLLNTDHYGYRLIPGILFIFILGSFFAEQSVLHPRNIAQKRVWAAAWLCAGIYAFVLLLKRDHMPFRVEVAVGLTCGLPLILLLQRFPAKKNSLKILNRRAGELSFGIFLYHFPVIWTLRSTGLPYTGLEAFPMVLLFSTLLAFAGHWGIERPLWRYMRPRVLG